MLPHLERSLVSVGMKLLVASHVALSSYNSAGGGNQCVCWTSKDDGEDGSC